MKKNAGFFFKPNSSVSGLKECVNLLKQWIPIWYNSCNYSHYLVKLMIIHCHSPRSICLLRRPKRRTECGCAWESLSLHLSSKSLMAAVFQERSNAYGLLFLGRDCSIGFHLASPSIIAFTPQFREPVPWSCPWPNMFIPNKHFKTVKNYHYNTIGLGVLWTHCKMD